MARLTDLRRMPENSGDPLPALGYRSAKTAEWWCPVGRPGRSQGEEGHQ
jgi:hypothetical protein